VEPGDLARADVLNHMGSGTGNAIILVCQLGSIFFSPSFSFIHFTLSCDKSDRADFLNHMSSGSGNDIILVCRLGSIFSLQVSVLFSLHYHVTSQTGFLAASLQ
jgi:hypothetical protein